MAVSLARVLRDFLIYDIAIVSGTRVDTVGYVGRNERDLDAHRYNQNPPHQPKPIPTSHEDITL